MLKIVLLGILPVLAWSNNVDVLHNFNNADGNDPKGSLNRSGNVLFGRTALGGDFGNGTISRIKTDGDDFQLLYSFTSGANNVLGNQPHHASMFLLGSTLYGAALLGGNTDQGTVFSIQKDGSNYQALHVFTGSAVVPLDGASPHSSPIFFDSIMYGMTANGGVNGEGTIYNMQLDGSQFQVIYSFDIPASPNGSQPHGQLTPSTDGNTLFGNTRKGGTADGGTIFALTNFRGVSPTPTYTVLHEFGSFPGDGETSDHGILLMGATLFGMTTNGGFNNNGVIFSINQSGADYRILHTFGVGTVNDGLQPFGSLTMSSFEILYGMTRNGGANGNGTIFQILPDGTGYRVLTSFLVPEGINPIDNVTVSSDGLTLFGMTEAGGAFGFGTIFSFRLPLDSFPPAIQNSFQADSQPVSMRSLTSIATANARRQIGSLTERQSSYRRAYYAAKTKEISLLTDELTASLSPPSYPIRKREIELFQKKVNFTLADSYQHARLFSHANVAGIRSNANAAILMSDVLLGKHVFLGEAIGYVSGQSRFDHHLGKTDLKSVLASIYTSLVFEHFFADVIGSYAWNFYEMHRKIHSFDLTAKSHPQGHLGALDLTLGYYVDIGKWALTPLAGLYYARTHVDSFHEHGAESLNMHVHAQKLDSLHTMLGLRVGRDFRWGSVHFLPEIQAGWEYECLKQSRHVASALVLYNFPFTIFLPEFNRNFFTWGGNLTAFLSSWCYAEFSYQGQYSHHNITASTWTGSLTFAF